MKEQQLLEDLLVAVRARRRVPSRYFVAPLPGAPDLGKISGESEVPVGLTAKPSLGAVRPRGDSTQPFSTDSASSEFEAPRSSPWTSQPPPPSQRPLATAGSFGQPHLGQPVSRPPTTSQSAFGPSHFDRAPVQAEVSADPAEVQSDERALPEVPHASSTIQGMPSVNLEADFSAELPVTGPMADSFGKNALPTASRSQPSQQGQYREGSDAFINPSDARRWGPGQAPAKVANVVPQRAMSFLEAVRRSVRLKIQS